MNNLIRGLISTLLILVLLSLFACGGDKESTLSSEKKAYFRDKGVVGAQVQRLPKASATRWIHIEHIGDWSISTEYAEGETAWCKLASEKGTNDAQIWINIDENKGEIGRKVVFKVKLADKIIPLSIEQSARDVKTSVRYSNMVEVPAFEETDKIKFMSHSMTVDGKVVRNYTVLYDTENLYPIWVAYPHNDYCRGSVKRTNAWQYDPNLGKSLQPDMFNGIDANYKGIDDGYDRGHMLPSFARTATKEMNEQTFYYTNMSAQLGGFNQQKWLKTEQKVAERRGSGSDTLFVVTGCVLQTVGGNEPIKRHRNKNDGKMMVVPNYYYKVVLKTFEDGRKDAIAFWLEHKNATGNPTKADTRSVRWVEEKTGINFFANLPQDLQDSFENQHNPEAWGVKN